MDNYFGELVLISKIKREIGLFCILDNLALFHICPGAVDDHDS